MFTSEKRRRMEIKRQEDKERRQEKARNAIQVRWNRERREADEDTIDESNDEGLVRNECQHRENDCSRDANCVDTDSSDGRCLEINECSTYAECIDQSEFMLSDEQKDLIKKGFYFCPYCSSINKKLNNEHFNSICCNQNIFYAPNGWSLIFNSCLNNKLIDSTTLTDFLNSQSGTSILYVVRKGPLLSDLLYVGVCRSLRVGWHKGKKLFAEFKQIEVGVLFSNISKQCGEFIESLIILSSLLPGNLLNTCYEYSNLQSFIGCKNIENFHENVAKYHHSAITILTTNWQKIQWTPFETTCKKRILFSKEVVQILNNYYLEHISDPYPSNEVRCELARKTGLTILQVYRWFDWKRHKQAQKKRLTNREE